MIFINSRLDWFTWNVFLALIPVVLAQVIRLLISKDGHIRPLRKVPVFILGLAWLAFLPNTCYLITEWRHFLSIVDYGNYGARIHADPSAVVMLMQFTLFYFVFSGIGVLAFALAVRPIARIAKLRGMSVWVWGAPFFLLMSVGVYLGLVLRFNSWDLISRPEQVWRSVMDLSFHPTASLFAVIFAGILWFVYLLIDIWVDGLALRLKRR